MSDQLFGSWANRNEPDWVVFAYFDWIYGAGLFMQMLKCLTKRWGFGTDDVDCSFPDLNRFDADDHFCGVQFAYGILFEPDVVIVSDEDFSTYLSMACSRYLEEKPEYADRVRSMMLLKEHV